MTPEEERAKKAAYMREWRKTPTAQAYFLANRPKRNAYVRQWNADNLDKCRAIARKSARKHYPKRLEYKRELAKRSPEQIKAQWQAYYAERKGILIRPSKCSLCDRNENIQAHHHKGYAPENWLDVVWLCVPCHREADKRQRD